MSEEIRRLFEPAEESATWAANATRDLEAEIRRYFTGNVSEIVIEDDPVPGYYVRKIKLKRPVTAEIRGRATEALSHAKNCFDQATFAACTALNAPATKEKIYFPWATGTDHLEVRFGRMKIPDEVRDIFRDAKPYVDPNRPAGTDSLWRHLAEISNRRHDVGISVTGQVTAVRPTRIVGRNIEHAEIFLPQWDPATNEAKLARWKGQGKIEGDYSVEYTICISGEKMLAHAPIVEALRGFGEKAAGIVQQLRDRCIDLAA